MADIKDMQHIGNNSQLIAEGIVMGCVRQCNDYCKGDSVAVATIPAGVLVTAIHGIGYNPTEDTASLEVEIGSKEAGHDIHLYAWDGVTGKEELPKETLTLCDENIIINIVEDLPTGSKFCVIVEYLDPNTIVGDTRTVEPLTCPCDCPDVENVYGN